MEALDRLVSEVVKEDWSLKTCTMGTRLRDMICSVRASKTAAEERAVVAKECSVLRDAFKDSNQDYRHRNVAKLMFIHMLGYPTHFGQMECIKLIAASDFPEKRIGYLGLMLLLDERQEVLMLVTNSVKNDLHHSNQYITGLALCTLGNICTADMARDLSLEVEKLLRNNNSYIRKKAALCAVRIVRKVPELVESFTNPATNLLSDKHHGVLVAGVKLCTELCQISAIALEIFRKQVSTIVGVLKNLVISGYAPEYDVAGISDPLLQIKLLRLLRLVGRGDAESSDIMSDVLAQVATNTEGAKNAGNAILYECVQTIMAIEAIGGLRVLAVNILGRFLANRDNNIRYVALNTLVKVVSVDTQAVQRHRTTIVECVKDSDVSIRRRALELVYKLVNESNVKALTKELLEYLKVSDPEFRVDLTAKIAALVQRFAPNKQWYIDQMVLLMVEAGTFVKDEVTRSLVVVISNAIGLQGYTVRALYCAFPKWSGQESLVQVTLWCIGEYGEMLVNHMDELEGEDPQTVTESDVLDVVESVLRDTRVTPATVAFVLTALFKLSSRFPQCTERIKSLLLEFKGSLILEVQQRSIEFGSILNKHIDIKEKLLERMPVLDEASYFARRHEVGVFGQRFHRKPSICPKGSITATSTAHAPAPAPAPAVPTHLMDLLGFQSDKSLAHPSKSVGDALLNLFGGTPMSTSTSPVQGDADLLLDFLSLGEPTVSVPPSRTSPSVSPSPSGRIPKMVIHSLPPAQKIPAMEPTVSLPPSGTSPSASIRPSPRVPIIATQIPLPANRTSTITNQSRPPSRRVSTVVANQLPSHRASLIDVEPDPQQRGSLLDKIPTGLDFITPPMPLQPEAQTYPSIVALQTTALKVIFIFTKPPGSPQTTVIKALYSNMSSTPYTDFVFQAAVPKFMQLQLEPASSAVLPASGGGVITQIITVNNSMHGQKPLVMKVRLSYKADGQSVLEQGQVFNFPTGL